MTFGPKIPMEKEEERGELKKEPRNGYHDGSEELIACPGPG